MHAYYIKHYLHKVIIIENLNRNILVGEKCLAKDSGELWHKATIVDILEDKVQVMFDSDSHVAIKELQDIHPSGLKIP